MIAYANCGMIPNRVDPRFQLRRCGRPSPRNELTFAVFGSYQQQTTLDHPSRNRCEKIFHLYVAFPRRPSSTSILGSIELIFRGRAHRKLEPHPPSGQFPVNLPISVEPIIHTTLLLFIKDDLQHFTPIFLRSYSLSHDLHRVHHICQNRIMHRR